MRQQDAYTGHYYIGHNVMGHNYICHNSLGHYYIGHSYMVCGNRYAGQPVCQTGFCLVAEPDTAARLRRRAPRIARAVMSCGSHCPSRVRPCVLSRVADAHISYGIIVMA